MSKAPIRYTKHGIDHKTISVSLPGELAKRVRAEAERNGVSISSLVANALHVYLHAYVVGHPVAQREERSA